MSKIGKIIYWKPRRYLVAGFLFFFLAALPVFADIKAGVDKTTIALDSAARYTIEITGNEENPGLPPLTNLHVVSSSQSSNISIINGRTSVSKSFTYLLQPEKIGSAKVGDLEITVTKAEGKRSRQPARVRSRLPSVWDDFDEFFSSPFPRFHRQQAVKDPVKVNLKASRTTAYVNQQILLTFTFYRRVNLFSQPSYSPPDTTGFWAINLPAAKNLREEELNGINYLAQDFKTVLFPTMPGDFTIEPATLIAQSKELKTQPIKIRILPLPEKGRPANFAGSVGQYQLKVWLKDQEIERGQPVQVTAKIWGKGNIETISEPVCALPGVMKKLSSTAKDNLIKGTAGISGSKTFEIVIIPLKDGSFTLPSFEFSYFDPLKEQYQTLKSKSFKLNILPSTTPLPKELARELAKEDRQKPIVIVIPWGKIGGLGLKIMTSIFFWLPALFVLLAIFLFVLYKKFQRKLAADPAGLRQRKALKVAKKRLKKSFHLLKQDKLKEFVAEIFNATARYLGDKYGFSATGITIDSLRDILDRRGLLPEARRQLEDFFGECDLLRFTPAALSKAKAEELAKAAANLVVLIEKS